MCQAVAAAFQRTDRGVVRLDMRERESSAPVGRLHGSTQKHRRHRGKGAARISEDDLDIVRTLGNSRIDKLLRVLWIAQRRDLETVFRAVPAGEGDGEPARTKIRELATICSSNLINQHEAIAVAMHLELRSHTKPT